jgi:hypothetical protein
MRLDDEQRTRYCPIISPDRQKGPPPMRKYESPKLEKVGRVADVTSADRVAWTPDGLITKGEFVLIHHTKS